MMCPICKTVRLESIELVDDLKVFTCTVCGGNWLRYDNYWMWYLNNKEIDEKEKEIKNYLPVPDSKQAKICPDCGRILIKYKVDNRLDFYIDNCGGCNGIWLDKNEWENLKLNSLHNQIHSFFTKPWQKKLREEAARDNLQDKYIRKFGRWDYERLKEMREWIYKHKSKTEMLSYLIDEDPYKI
ncbi:MAG: zf-TFIIB domain-containing protein [Bacillota bacterium]